MKLYQEKFKIILLLFLIMGVFYLWNENKNEKIDINTQIKIVNETNKRFTHPSIKFSLEYPKELVAERFSEGDRSETIVFSNNSQNDNEKLGFQIFITEFGKDEALTRERILEDLPNATIEEPIEVVLGDGTKALIFWSEADGIGRTREVWFTHGGYLYEITTYENLDTWLAEIMNTWSFNEL